MRGGLIIETLTHLVLALNTVPWVAMVVMFVFGAHAFVWGTMSATVRQRAVPTQMQGRVASVYMIGVTGGIVVGSVLGGLIAEPVGRHGPVLVRLRRLGAVPGADLAPADPHRARRRGDRGEGRATVSPEEAAAGSSGAASRPDPACLPGMPASAG